MDANTRLADVISMDYGHKYAPGKNDVLCNTHIPRIYTRVSRRLATIKNEILFYAPFQLFSDNSFLLLRRTVVIVALAYCRAYSAYVIFILIFAPISFFKNVCEF